MGLGGAGREGKRRDRGKGERRGKLLAPSPNVFVWPRPCRHFWRKVATVIDLITYLYVTSSVQSYQALTRLLTQLLTIIKCVA